MKRKKILKKITLYFLNGLLVLLPVIATFYLLNYGYRLINGWGILWFRLPKEWQFPGLGLVLILGIVILVGFLTRLWFAKKLLDILEGILKRIPLINGLYVTIKDTLHSFIGEKKSFDTVVLVSIDSSKRLGFLTVKEPVFQTKDKLEYLGVYFPQSMQISGDLYWVQKENIERVDMAVEEALRIILSAGVASGRK